MVQTKLYPANWNNCWYNYCPRIGFDPYIQSSHIWRGALYYAMSKSHGLSEEECHNRAERGMFLSAFSGLTYTQEVETDSQQDKKIRCLASHNWPPMSLPKTVEIVGES